ncbi:MAG: hypothetical protein U9Q37_01195 [Euryarchaeota archaeon]|nr:hypothetical protein [Euryarchaeota archaeon]
MEDQAMSPIQIKKVGLEALAEALGPVGMVRFLQLFETGSGDYTKDRDKWLGKTSVQSVVEEIKKRRKM